MNGDSLVKTIGSKMSPPGFNMKCCAILLIFPLLEHCLALTDINLHELQYISDHLSYYECRQLSAALQLRIWELPENITSSAEPAVPCLMLLLRYTRRQGRGKTFHDLSQRIRQIGRADLAKQFSRMMRHKKAEAIREDFLDNPFREKIGVTSVFLDPLDNDDDDDRDAILRKVKNENSSSQFDGIDIMEDDIGGTESMLSMKDFGHYSEFVDGLSNTQIGLSIAAALSVLLLCVTFCICGCPRLLATCFRFCTPHPLTECIHETNVFIRVDLCNYLSEVCCKKSMTESDTDNEMKKELMSIH